MVFLVMRWSAENTEEKKKTDRRKTLGPEQRDQKERQRIRGKSNNNNIHPFKLYYPRKHNLKKS